MRTWLASAVTLLLLATTALAEPVGSYNISGLNPGSGSPYSGTATVEKSGDTYRVIWVIDGQRYLGTAIGDKDFLAISYRSGDQTGLALYGAEGSGWKGVWTYYGSRQLGTEQWTRRDGGMIRR